MNRISVIGCSGSGKTTMARALSQTLGIPRLELDSVYHQPNWTPLPEDEFVSRVADFTDADRWVVDGNYTSLGVNDVVFDRADTVVWVDMPRHVVMRRVISRSFGRAFTGEELWNGNTERWANLFKVDPEENIITWAWTRYASTKSKYEQRLGEARFQHLEVFRLRSPKESDAFLRVLASG